MSKPDIIVLGGSVGGCLAAAAAARAGAEVLILEQDAEPTAALPRKGTPQSRQLHVLLDGGRRAAEKLLPGLSEDLVAHGSFVGDSCADVRWYHGGVWKLRTSIDKPVYCQTRPLFESRIREAVRRLPNVQMRFLTEVKEPIHEGGTVRGVRLESGELIESELVIDATGRNSALPRWLTEWGYGEVFQRRVSLGLTYVSGVFEAPSRDLLDAMLLVYAEPPHMKRAGLATRVEGGRCIVTLQGYHGERPPRDIEGFRAYAQSLARPDLAELLAGRKPLGELAMHPFPYQVRREYSQLPRFPRGIVPIGDVIASVDPAFGQGMSIAALEAVELHQWLSQGIADQRLLPALARIAEPAWLMTAWEASRWPEMHGERPAASRVINWYLDGFLRACEHSEAAVRAFYDVIHLTADLQSLARPDLLARVLWPDAHEVMAEDAAQLLGRLVASLAGPPAQPPMPEVRFADEPVHHIRVRQDALHRCEVASGPSLPNEGQAVLRVRQFAITTNNVTYALVGKQMGYFRFFPAADGWGCVPAWGFAEVIRSSHPDLSEGELLFGFVPMASHMVLSPGEPTPYTITETARHRRSFSPIYNTYWRASNNPLFAAAHDEWSLFGPLFMTGFALAAELQRDCGGAEQVIVSSASSKTALCLASALRSAGSAVRIVGLTSAAHVGFARSTGLFDQVVGYTDLGQLAEGPTAFIDIAGNAGTLASIHHRFRHSLKKSVMLGSTNWHGFHGLAPDPTLPGATPTFFFAPEHIQKQLSEWGFEGFMQRFASPWGTFLESMAPCLTIRHTTGAGGAIAAYLQAFGGQLSGCDGLICHLSAQ